MRDSFEIAHLVIVWRTGTERVSSGWTRLTKAIKGLGKALKYCEKKGGCRSGVKKMPWMIGDLSLRGETLLSL
jgi:hypothetical protein